jgi:hypothetical protein
MSKYLNTTFFLAIIPAILYLSGYINFIAYLEEWGIDKNLIIFNKDDILVSSSINLLVYTSSNLSDVLNYINSNIIIFMTILSIYIIKPLHEEISSFFNDIDETIKIKTFMQIFFILSLIILLMRISGDFLIYSINSGTERAKKERIEFSTNNSDKLKLVTINSIEKSAYLIINDSKNYAFYFPKTTKNKESIEIIPKLHVTKIRIFLK